MKSRSTRPENAIRWRHPLLFTAEEVTDQYPDYDPEKPLTQYADTKRDAYWLFRRHRGWTDEERIAGLMRQPDINWEKFVKDYESDPGAAVAEVTTTEVASYHRAFLAQMTVGWVGPYFTIPADFTVEDLTGSGDQREAETLHSLAGQLMPVDVQWVGTLDTALIVAAKEFLDSLYAGRNPDQEATFRERAPDVAPSLGNSGGTSKPRKPRAPRRAKP